VWRQDEYDLVIKSTQKSPAPITVLTNLSQATRWGYQFNSRYDQNGNYLRSLLPNENTLFKGKEYTLLVNIDNDDNNSMSRLSYLPLHHASSFIFYGRHNLSHGCLFNYISNYPKVKSFSIINSNPSCLPNVTISSYFPQLRKLSLEFQLFPPVFQLTGYLPITLHELRLRHDNGGSFPNLAADIELPQLRVLEITFPGAYLLDRLTAKTLKSLTLYGPHDCTKVRITFSDKATEIYNRLLHLNFEDWKAALPALGTRTQKKGQKGKNTFPIHGTAVTKKDLIDKMPSLSTLAFTRSFVHGRTLVSVIETLMKNMAKRKSLKGITLSHSIGITNDECEELRKLVKSVNIYM
jgi:hypothetical protein